MLRAQPIVKAFLDEEICRVVVHPSLHPMRHRLSLSGVPRPRMTCYVPRVSPMQERRHAGVTRFFP
jgi:hypothetical protein